MKKVANGFTPIIALDRGAAKRLHWQIYDAYRTTIAGRNLRPGEKVPSSRDLAQQLGISRVPVLKRFGTRLALTSLIMWE